MRAIASSCSRKECHRYHTDPILQQERLAFYYITSYARLIQPPFLLKLKVDKPFPSQTIPLYQRKRKLAFLYTVAKHYTTWYYHYRVITKCI